MITTFFLLFLFFSSPVSAENLLQNPDFESSSGNLLESWADWGGDLEATSSPILSGNHSAMFTSSGSAVTKYFYQTVPIISSANYSFSAFTLKNEATGSVYLRISWYESAVGSGSAISNSDSKLLSGEVPSFQEILIQSVRAPENANSAKVKLMLKPETTATVAAYFDNVTFQLIPPEDEEDGDEGTQEPEETEEPQEDPKTQPTEPEPPPEKPLSVSFSHPPTAQVNTPFEIAINVELALPNTDYQVKSLIGSTPTSSGGSIYNPGNDSWPVWNSPWDKFPTLTTDASGSASCVFKVKSSEKATEGPHYIRIRLLQQGKDDSITSEPQSIHLTEPPSAEENVATEEATATAPLSINFALPEEVSLGEEFEIEIEVTNAEPSTVYHLKFLAGPDEGKLTKGQTFNANNSPPDNWLSNSDHWGKFPKFFTDQKGFWSGKIKARLSETAEPGSYFTAIRIRKENESRYYDSVTYLLKAITFPEEGKVLGQALISIAFAREQPDETEVSVEGVVTAPPDLLGKGTFYIQDETGGIMIRIPSKASLALSLGDRVTVQGQMGSSRGERYLDVGVISEINVLTRASPPEPKVVQTSQIQQDYEGQLVTIKGKVVETKGNTFYLDDGSGKAKVYIKKSAEIKKPKMKVGQMVQVIGVVSQYENSQISDPGYRLLPRYDSDIKILPLTGGNLPFGIPFLFLGLGLRAALIKAKDFRQRPLDR
jgi:uncharacterized protein YdeI (BOF family)